MDVTATRGTCRVVSGGRSEGPRPTCWMLVSVPGWAPRPRGGGGRRHQGLLSAQTDGQAVPRVRVFFPPPAGAVVLVVSSVAHGGPHASTAHTAVRAALAVVVGAFQGQLHAAVLLERQRGTAAWAAALETPDATAGGLGRGQHASMCPSCALHPPTRPVDGERAQGLHPNATCTVPGTEGGRRAEPQACRVTGTATPSRQYRAHLVTRPAQSTSTLSHLK